jgi:aerobic carbon-monoxide dehydrogenase large subunit
MAAVPKFTGQRIKRVEDHRLITGAGTYVDDVKLPGMLAAVFLRSPHAHARINSIELGAARRLKGVVAVLSGDDVNPKVGSLLTAVPAQNVPYHPPLASGRVRYVGEPVAVVVATDPYRAQDAADLIEVDYEPLPALVDPEKALEPGAPIIHEEIGTNLAHHVEFGLDQIARAMRAADRVVKFRIVQQRLAPFAMEPRAALAHWNAGARQLTTWVSTQGPHLFRSLLAETLKMAETQIRVIAPDVGGGFGSKLNSYGDEVVTAYLAMLLSRPVKWNERRRENFSATTHGRGLVVQVEVAVKNDGTVLGIKAKFFCDMGAYLHLVSPMVPGYAAIGMTGCYKIPALAFEQSLVFTNKMGTDAYRGAGRPEAIFTAERAMDQVAAELGLDPAEVRRRNFIAADAFPYRTPGGLVYDSGNYQEALEKTLAMIDYAKVRAEQAEARKAGRHIGVGIASYVEIGGVGPPGIIPPRLKGGWESATIRIEPDCKVTVLTGASPHGQGEETTFAQLVADGFGIDLNDVSVVHGDTAAVQYGIGTFGSRTAAVGGAAVMRAVEKVQEKMKKIASAMMEVPPEQLIFHRHTVAMASDPTKSIPLKAVVDAAYSFTHQVPRLEPGLTEAGSYSPTACPFSHGCHVAVVEVDAESGAVKFIRYAGIDDCGNIINPLLVEGQLHGGIAQGIGQALFEEVVYDDNGQLLSATLMDYVVPKAAMLPRCELDFTVTPSPVNPLGVKGVGEAGTVASTACVVNAVVDALRPFGVRHIDMPLKPENVWRAIKSSRRG